MYSTSILQSQITTPPPQIQMYLFPLFSPLLGCTEEASLPLSLSPPTSLFTPSFCREFRSCVPSNVTAPFRQTATGF